jgi:hypothetical protein
MHKCIGNISAGSVYPSFRHTPPKQFSPTTAAIRGSHREMSATYGSIASTSSALTNHGAAAPSQNSNLGIFDNLISHLGAQAVHTRKQQHRTQQH